VRENNMATGLNFSLTAFEEAVRSDPDILGVFYTGSLGQRSGDRFSDLDINVWIADSLAEPTQKRLQLLALLGDVRFFYPKASGLNVTGFVGLYWQRVDIDVFFFADLSPRLAWAKATVVKDTDGAIARLVSESPKALSTIELDCVVSVIEEAIDSQIYLALHNARGAFWSAMGEVTDRANVLYTCLARLRGYESFGFRYVEKLLTDTERALLNELWPTHPERMEIRRAARALWTWTRYVWIEAERALQVELPIAIDENELLASVNTIYTL
jgi:hypothetical protein